MASKAPSPRQQKRLAVLIDADNAPAAIVEGLFEEIAKYEAAKTKCIFGIRTSVRYSCPLEIHKPRIQTTGKWGSYSTLLDKHCYPTHIATTA